MSKSEFREKLLSLSCQNIPEVELPFASEELMKAFLRFGSETPDNVNCFEHIEWGLVVGLPYGSGGKYGLKLKGKNLLLSEVLNVVEDLEIPGHVRERFPELTNDEWSAVMRIATMVVLALERESE